MKEKLFIAGILFCLFGCGGRDLIKEITIKEYDPTPGLTTLSWYSSGFVFSSHECVDIKKANGDAANLVTCGDGLIIDVELETDTVIIKIYNFKPQHLYKKQTHLDNYSVIFKNASEQEWFKHFHPKEKFHPIKIRSDSTIKRPHN